MSPDLVRFCKENGILLEAYSTLARAHKMVAFSLANGCIACQKSNLEGGKVKLSAEHLAKLANLGEFLIVRYIDGSSIKLVK
ncbi:hypothetical protein P3T76_008978 [Phytophthora citrophthora]|uniref:NADP-dependent oxidoreductase domain-containing protein n=1 Tax=Phytophthora citrophthora TaxID=4793 RepID=A0AAD9LJD3_9STRA|nr:hypothetical protein P3T76_008978 [Phytophthora citrophthora]